MKRTDLAKLLLVALPALAVVWAAAGQEAQPTTKPASTQAVTTPQAAPEKKADREKEEEAIPKALVQAAKSSFVVVKIWYKKDLSEPAGLPQSNWRIRRIYEEYVDNKYPEERSGLVLDAEGHVLVADDATEDRFIEKIEVCDLAGESFPARRHKLLAGTSAVLLEVDKQEAAKLKPLEFVPLKEAGTDTRLFQAGLFKTDDEWRIRFGPLRPAVRYAPGEEANAYFGYRTPQYRGRYAATGYAGRPTIIADEEGRPVGCAADQFMDLRQKECVWKGPDLLKAEGIPWTELKKSEKAVRAKLTAAVQEVVIAFHQGEQGESERSYGPRSEGPTAAAGREVTLYGAAISETDILVPWPVNSKVAAQISKLYVKFSPWVRRRADFVGAFKDIGGFVIRMRSGKLPAHLELANEDPARMKPFWVASARKRYGRTYVDLVTNRLHGKSRGYAGQYHWYAAEEIPNGAMLVDFDGLLTGMYLHQRVEHEEERQLERRGSYYQPRNRYRVYPIAEIRGELTRPLAHLDAKVKVRTRIESKRRSWFGVEFVVIRSDLAEQLKVEKPTKDGQLGFLVSAVYPGSPAEKLGVKVGDILLRIQPPQRPYPIELNAELAGAGRYDYAYSRRFRMPAEAMGPPEASWKNRANGLTRALDAVGIGEKVTVTYYRPEGEGKGKTVDLKYTIEQAPPDLDSAPKWQNRKVGLTVKDLTYEIRFALKLKPDAAGVIVANVEEGSPMATARIFPNEILTLLEGKPLTSARQMRDLVAAAQKAGKDKVRLTIFRLGKTRLADLTIKAYSPADDEGLEEEEEETEPAATTGPARG